MTPIELSNLYQTLRNRISVHVPDGCAEISLRLPDDFGDELAFYRLINWGYVLINEAARIPLAFLTNLPPLKADNSLRTETSNLRTYLVHNLDITRKKDQRTYAFVHRWFRAACGRGTPDSNDHYGDCCVYLADRIREALTGAIEACDLLDDSVDGPRLLDDFRSRIDLDWEAHRFDPLVARCADRLGNPGIDLLTLRSRRLDKWRSVLSTAEEQERERVLEQRIEADILEAIGDVLPRTVQDNLQRIAANTDVTVAILLLLREARRIGTMTLPQIIEFVSSQVLEKDLSR